MPSPKQQAAASKRKQKKAIKNLQKENQALRSGALSNEGAGGSDISSLAAGGARDKRPVAKVAQQEQTIIDKIKENDELIALGAKIETARQEKESMKKAASMLQSAVRRRQFEGVIKDAVYLKRLEEGIEDANTKATRQAEVKQTIGGHVGKNAKELRDLSAVSLTVNPKYRIKTDAGRQFLAQAESLLEDAKESRQREIERLKTLREEQLRAVESNVDNQRQQKRADEIAAVRYDLVAVQKSVNKIADRKIEDKFKAIAKSAGVENYSSRHDLTNSQLAQMYMHKETTKLDKALVEELRQERRAILDPDNLVNQSVLDSIKSLAMDTMLHKDVLNKIARKTDNNLNHEAIIGAFPAEDLASIAVVAEKIKEKQAQRSQQPRWTAFKDGVKAIYDLASSVFGKDRLKHVSDAFKTISNAANAHEAAAKAREAEAIKTLAQTVVFDNNSLASGSTTPASSVSRSRSSSDVSVDYNSSKSSVMPRAAGGARRSSRGSDQGIE